MILEGGNPDAQEKFYQDMRCGHNKDLMSRIEKLLNENFEKVNKMMTKANKESLEN